MATRIFLPETLDDLWALLDGEPDSVLYAGGTDLLVKKRAGLISPRSLICLERIEELRKIEDDSGTIYLGACVTHSQILGHPVLNERVPILTKAIQTLGSPLIRNMGTLGGNICTASPAADTLPPLYTLGAEVRIRSKKRSRKRALHEFVSGPGKTSLRPKEIVFGIGVKKDLDYNVHHYEKVGQRKALAIAVASLAALIKVSKANIIERARLAWGSLGPTIVTSKEIEEKLIGKPLHKNTLIGLFPMVREVVSPIDDIRGSAEYRRTLACHLLLRLLQYKGTVEI